MLQIKTFELPAEEDKANAFLALHKPVGEIARMGDLLFLAYDDGREWPAEQIAALRELLQGNRAAKFQMQVALHVMEYELADLNPVKNKPRYEEVSFGIREMKKQLDIQDVKAQFVEARIAALESQYVGDPATQADPAEEEAEARG
jgi:hypothetical protein